MNRNLEALRWIGHCLNPEHSELTLVVEQRMRAGDLAWPRLMQLAFGHFLAPSLWLALRRRDLLDRVPAEMQDLLAASHVLNRQRNAIHYEALIESAATLNAIGIEPMVLKGGVALLPGHYRDAEGRMLSDLDLLIPEDRVGEAIRALQSAGYRADAPGCHDGSLGHHSPPLYHAHQPVRLELHRWAVAKRLPPILSTSAMWETSEAWILGRGSVFRRPTCACSTTWCIPSCRMPTFAAAAWICAS